MQNTPPVWRHTPPGSKMQSGCQNKVRGTVTGTAFSGNARSCGPDTVHHETAEEP